jgi:hypothetical protein
MLVSSSRFREVHNIPDLHGLEAVNEWGRVTHFNKFGDILLD